MFCQPLAVDGGLIHASRVAAALRCSDAESGMVTMLLVPLKESALPNFPAALHEVAETVPVLLFPEASRTVEPALSSKAKAATRPLPNVGVGVGVGEGVGVGLGVGVG